jgi:hypothetical protein
LAYRSSMQRSPPVRRRGSGACQDTPRSNKPYATTTSTHSVSPDCMSLLKLNPVEPPWYVTRMPGGVGRVAPRGVPLSRSSAQLRHPGVSRRSTAFHPRQHRHYRHPWVIPVVAYDSRARPLRPSLIALLPSTGLHLPNLMRSRDGSGMGLNFRPPSLSMQEARDTRTRLLLLARQASSKRCS